MMVVSLARSEEHTSELQSHSDLVCRLLLEKTAQSRPSFPPTPSARSTHTVVWIGAVPAGAACVAAQGEAVLGTRGASRLFFFFLKDAPAEEHPPSPHLLAFAV